LLQSQVAGLKATQDNVVNQILNDMVHSGNLFIIQKRKWFTSCNTCRCHLAKSMWHDKHVAFVLLHDFFFELTVTFIHKEIYSPANILRAMDIAGGQLSVEGIEVLHTCEMKGTKYNCNSVLPCPVNIQHVGAEVEKLQSITYHINMVFLTLEAGEYIELVPQQMIAMVMKGFGLEEQAKGKCITIHQATDGAQLSKTIMHITNSFKMADHGALCPFSKKPLFAGNENEAPVQLRNNCFLLKIIRE